MASTIVRQGTKIFLNVSGKWYYYDEQMAPLGSGAMGTVYLGYSKATRERVAIKRIVDKYANIPSIRERAKQEATLMFRHANLIEMIGACELKPNAGPLFIVSKFVSGVNIDVFIKTSLPQNFPHRTERICKIFDSVLSALEYIHSYNIIHMDIKPSNIMVENGRNVRLMDLGIAFVDHRDKSDEISSSGLMGTPRYAAPEQFVHSNDMHLNCQTDIYEAGVTLYELLSDKNPFSANNIQETIRKHQTVVLPYIKEVPNQIVDVLRKATAPKQEDRFNTVSEFRTALQHALTEHPQQYVWLYALLASAALITLLLIWLAIS